MGGAGRLRADFRRAVLRQSSLFRLYPFGLLAHQPGLDPDSRGNRSGAAGGCLSLDGVLRRTRLELGRELREDIAAGLLGSRDAGILNPDEPDPPRADGF